jgi:hypothetical protein
MESALRASLGEEHPRPWPAAAGRRPATTAEVGDAVLAELALLLGSHSVDVVVPAIVIPCHSSGEP